MNRLPENKNKKTLDYCYALSIPEQLSKITIHNSLFQQVP